MSIADDVANMVERYGAALFVEAIVDYVDGDTLKEIINKLEARAMREAADIEAETVLK